MTDTDTVPLEEAVTAPLPTLPTMKSVVESTPTPTKPGYKTTEFWLTLLANAIGSVVMVGIVAEGSLPAKYCAAALMLLSTLGYQFARAQVKSSAATSTVTTTLSTMLLVGLLAACGANVGVLTRTAAGDFYDCVQPSVKQAGLELGGVFDRAVRSTIQNDGTLDRQALKATATGLKDPALRCLFATAITTLGTAIARKPDAPQSEPLLVNPADAEASFDEVRTELFNNARFKLEDGVH